MLPSLLRTSTFLAGVSFLALSTLVLPLATAGQAGAATLSPTSVITAARSAIAKQAGVHLTVTRKSSTSSVVEKVNVDLAPAGGVETISQGRETVTIRVTPTYAYVSGNSSGLTKIIGLTAAEAKKVGKDWVSVKNGTTQYSGVAGGMSVAAVSGLLPAVKGTTLSRGTSSGLKVYILKWDTTPTSSQPKLSISLTVSAVGATLPVEELTKAAGGGEEDVTLTKWGEHVRVNAPPASSTIPYATVAG